MTIDFTLGGAGYEPDSGASDFDFSSGFASDSDFASDFDAGTSPLSGSTSTGYFDFDQPAYDTNIFTGATSSGSDYWNSYDSLDWDSFSSSSPADSPFADGVFDFESFTGIATATAIESVTDIDKLLSRASGTNLDVGTAATAWEAFKTDKQEYDDLVASGAGASQSDVSAALTNLDASGGTLTLELKKLWDGNPTLFGVPGKDSPGGQSLDLVFGSVAEAPEDPAALRWTSAGLRPSDLRGYGSEDYVAAVSAMAKLPANSLLEPEQLEAARQGNVGKVVDNVYAKHPDAEALVPRAQTLRATAHLAGSLGPNDYATKSGVLKERAGAARTAFASGNFADAAAQAQAASRQYAEIVGQSLEGPVGNALGATVLAEGTALDKEVAAAARSLRPLDQDSLDAVLQFPERDKIRGLSRIETAYEELQALESEYADVANPKFDPTADTATIAQKQRYVEYRSKRDPLVFALNERTGNLDGFTVDGLIFNSVVGSGRELNLDNILKTFTAAILPVLMYALTKDDAEDRAKQDRKWRVEDREDTQAHEQSIIDQKLRAEMAMAEMADARRPPTQAVPAMRPGGSGGGFTATTKV